ncbi:MAG: insulinase family protein, partial [Oscillospiraceae bacterium]|nr:insulinase family protein [Oscillospiraceae bacterium]
MSKITLKQTIKYSALDAEYYVYETEAGLQILLYPMPEVSGAYALFGTKYGSVDVEFKRVPFDKGGAVKSVEQLPDGIAHYLEHKLFESADENGKAADAFRLFAKTGANANAYTSFDRTAYLFSSDADTFYDNLRILLGFVQDPYFTEENVAKEQGIIGQEINMYRDDPGWRVFFNCLQGVYHNNPVRRDIAGTVESIAEITPELLYECYNTFYSQGNMLLSLAGNIDPEKTIALCEELLKDPSEKFTVEHAPYDEPKNVRTAYTEEKLPCAFPLYQLGFKLPVEVEKSKAAYDTDVQLSLLLDILFGELTTWYDTNFESGLINAQFSADVFSGRGFLLPIVSGECETPEKVKDAVIAEIKNVQANGFTDEHKELFELLRKSTYGGLVNALSSPQSVAGVMLEAHILGKDFFSKAETIKRLTIETLFDTLKMIETDNYALSVVK